MLLPYIITLVMILVITAYMASNSMLSTATQARISFEKTKFTFSTEQLLKDSIDMLCASEPNTCKNKYDSSTDTIELTISDLTNYLPTGFQNKNQLGGTFTKFIIKDNNTTIEMDHFITKDTSRYVYLHHYKGLMYSIPPQCISGNKDSNPPCDNDKVYHNYPLSQEARNALK